MPFIEMDHRIIETTRDMATKPPDGNRHEKHEAPLEPTPRWVKVFAGVLAVLLLVFLVMHLAGGGFGDHRR
jgi:hypothetical protein